MQPTCRAQRGRSCEQLAREGVDSHSLAGCLRKKSTLSQSNVALAETMVEAFIGEAAAFMPNRDLEMSWRPNACLCKMKLSSVTFPNPTRGPRHPWLRPEPYRCVNNVHEEQANSW